MVLITLTLLVLVIALSVYVAHRQPPLLSVADQIPVPKPHEHTTTDGSTVQHIHTYDFTKPDTPTDKVKQAQEIGTKHPIQRAWERLDLAAIKKKYQPYTLAEMKEKWHQKYIEYGVFSSEEEAAAEEYYPLDEWLEDLIGLGHPFIKAGHYRLASDRRLGLMGRSRENWDTGIPEYSSITGEVMGFKSKAALLTRLKLPSDTTWNEYIEMHNKFSVVRLMNVLRAQEIDPDVDGGVTDLDGSFLPFSPNLVNVHVDPETGRTKFIGPSLTSTEKTDLVNFGVAPEGMSVVYIDANNKPIPVGKVPPRFYERNMAELEKAQVNIQQQLKDHEFLLDLDTLLNTPEAKQQGVAISHERPQDPEHVQTQGAQRSSETASSPQRPHPSENQPTPDLEITPELRTPDAIYDWFARLEALHGGKLPKDLQALQRVITELEKIKEAGEKNMEPPRPERPSPPPVTAPPEGNPDPDGED